MAKIAFSKLKCKVNEEVKVIDFNDEKIEVKQYLPVQEKLQLAETVINQAYDEDYAYANPMKIKVFLYVEMLYAYTNISFTDKQKENLPRLYDTLVSSLLLSLVLDAIPESEKEFLEQGINKSIQEIYAYQHSAMGIIDMIKSGIVDMEEMGTSVEQIKEDISQLEQLPTVKGILQLLGSDESSNS